MSTDLRRAWIYSPDGNRLDKSPDEIVKSLQRNLQIGADGKIGNATLDAYIRRKSALATSNPQTQAERTAQQLASEAQVAKSSRRLSNNVWIDFIRYAMNNLRGNYWMGTVFESPYGFVIPPMDRALPSFRPSQPRPASYQPPQGSPGEAFQQGSQSAPAPSSTPPQGQQLSPDAAARELHQYVSTTPANRRDRQRVARLQTAMGLTGDGLFGQGTATKIFDLTGLRIQGFRYPGSPAPESRPTERESPPDPTPAPTPPAPTPPAPTPPAPTPGSELAPDVSSSIAALGMTRNQLIIAGVSVAAAVTIIGIVVATSGKRD